MTQILLYQNTHQQSLADLLNKYGLKIVLVDNKNIPGSYWGESEAGLITNELFVRADTPVHSIMHEACHYVCMDTVRREQLDTNAEGDYDEENAVCYLQIVLAKYIEGYSPKNMRADMDSWGYTFRLGSATAWFKDDAEDALAWLVSRGLISKSGCVTWQLNN